jgi:hypothetical protein
MHILNEAKLLSLSHEGDFQIEIKVIIFRPQFKDTSKNTLCGQNRTIPATF